MVAGCERCKKARVSLSIIFVTLIVINFAFRAVFNIATTSLSDVLVVPSFGLIVSAILIYLLIRNKS